MKIIFDDFIKTEQKIIFNIKIFYNNKLITNDEIYFELSEKIDIDDNLIATALSTLCGKEYDEIYYDLILHENTIKQISLFTNAKVEVKNIDNTCYLSPKNKFKIILNFSGGFDSLAAKTILGDMAELVSISFFDIEEHFFKKFKPYTVKTNFRKLDYDKNHWTFMGVASILYSNFLKAKYQTFGTIFEATTIHSNKNISLKKEFKDCPFNTVDIQDIKIIQSLTEIGTALILCNSNPYLVNDSLKSLSNPKTEKRYRKELIIETLCNKFNLNIYLEHTEAPEKIKRKNWGEYYTVDFLSLYLIKYAGIEETSKILNNIPKEAIDFVKTLPLEFYEKYNPNFLNNVPAHFKFEITKNLAKSKILPYNQNDYEELHRVLEFLSIYHQIF